MHTVVRSREGAENSSAEQQRRRVVGRGRWPCYFGAQVCPRGAFSLKKSRWRVGLPVSFSFLCFGEEESVLKKQSQSLTCVLNVRGAGSALNNLQEFELTYNLRFGGMEMLHRFAPRLSVAKFSRCHFTDLAVELPVKFPCLKQLTLDRVTISEEALQSIFCGSPSLESLELKETLGIGRLCISSQTLKSIGFCAGMSTSGVFLREVVIEDAPCLERLLPLDPTFGPSTIRIISAPKLKILGMLSEGISEFHFGTTVIKKMVDVNLTAKMHTVRVLGLDSTGPNLDGVLNILKCFPCLERLYVIFQSGMNKNKVRYYDPLDPVECLELCLKRVVLKNYDGTMSSCIDFAKFFVLNAKVLKEMKITLPYHREHKWFANQHRLLQIENRASRVAKIELECGNQHYFTHNWNTHDLSMSDPFDMPSSGCSKCN